MSRSWRLFEALKTALREPVKSVQCEAPLPPVGDGVIHDRLPGPGVNEGLRVVRHHDVIIPATGPLA